MKKNKSIKYWAREDKPREKLSEKGARYLSNAELIAILLGSGTREISAVELAREILLSVDNKLNDLSKKSIHELMKTKGVGEAKAITVTAAFELGKRCQSEEAVKRSSVTSSHDIYEIVYPLLSDLSHEEIWVLLLNRANHIIDTVKTSQGGVSGTVFDIKLIMKHAVEKLATSMILCHNHPSGNVQPSKKDIEITGKTGEAARILDIKLLDHIIIGNRGYYSFLDEGLLQSEGA